MPSGTAARPQTGRSGCGSSVDGEDIVCAVSDCGPFVPPRRKRDMATEEGGRGFAFMSALTDQMELNVEPHVTVIELRKRRSTEAVWPMRELLIRRRRVVPLRPMSPAGVRPRRHQPRQAAGDPPWPSRRTAERQYRLLARPRATRPARPGSCPAPAAPRRARPPRSCPLDRPRSCPAPAAPRRARPPRSCPPDRPRSYPAPARSPRAPPPFPRGRPRRPCRQLPESVAPGTAAVRPRRPSRRSMSRQPARLRPRPPPSPLPPPALRPQPTPRRRPELLHRRQPRPARARGAPSPGPAPGGPAPSADPLPGRGVAPHSPHTAAPPRAQ